MTLIKDPIDKAIDNHMASQDGAALPYAATGDLPDSLRERLPAHAQEIFLAAFNSAWHNHAGDDPERLEETAHRIACAAVKRK